MAIGEPPPDPFEGMSPAERKRALELAILEMTYDLSQFNSVDPGERPDFALTRRPNGLPFGVEITQLFPDESHARLNLVHGYFHRLWSGGSHLHKEDTKVLQSVTVDIRDKEGNVKQAGVPAILTETADLGVFRSRLRDVIRSKTAKGYDSDEFTHLNLVILDWFDLPFEGSEYMTDRFFDDEVRAALKKSPFREVFLLINSSRKVDNVDADVPAHPDRRIIPLQELLAMERVYVTGHILDEEWRGSLRDTAHLNSLVIDHVSRVQGYGQAVECEGRPFLRYRGSLIEVSERGMQVRDHQDFPVGDYADLEIRERMDPAVEDRVTARASQNIFGLGFALPANRPSTWITG